MIFENAGYHLKLADCHFGIWFIPIANLMRIVGEWCVFVMKRLQKILSISVRCEIFTILYLNVDKSMCDFTFYLKCD